MTSGEIETVLPHWAQANAEAEIAEIGPLSPSDLGGAKALYGEGSEALDEEAAKRRGRQLHLLLEHLPAWDQAEWDLHAHTLLAAGDNVANAAEITELLAEARRVLTNPDLAYIFAPDTLAEVEITAELPGYNRVMSGIIDRLIVTPDAVTVVDFKSNRMVPDQAKDTPEGVLRQMAAYRAALQQIYPNRPIHAEILWTYHAKLMPLEGALLDSAYDRLDAGEVGS